MSWSDRSANAYSFMALVLLALLVVAYPLGIFERTADLLGWALRWGILRLGDEQYLQSYADGAVRQLVRIVSWALLPAVLVRLIIDANFAARVRHIFILPANLALLAMVLGVIASLAGAAFLS